MARIRRLPGPSKRTLHTAYDMSSCTKILKCPLEQSVFPLQCVMGIGHSPRPSIGPFNQPALDNTLPKSDGIVACRLD